MPLWLPDTVQEQLGSAVMEILAPLCNGSMPPPQSAPVSPFTRCSSLLDALHALADQQLLQQHVASPVAAILVGPVQQGNAPAEVSSLLATLVKHFGDRVVVGGSSDARPGQGRTTGSLKRALLSATLACLLYAPRHTFLRACTELPDWFLDT